MATEKSTEFWHEKMRFSNASQTLFEASLKGDQRLAAQALSGLGDPNCCNQAGYRPLQVAISCGHLALADLLLRSGANINVHAATTPPPLVLGVGGGDEEMVSLLLANAADVTEAEPQTGETALIRAADRGFSRIIQQLLRGSPGFQKVLAQRARNGPRGDGATALHAAARRGSNCERLLGVGADPDARDWLGRGALHEAVDAGHVETAQLLLSFGAACSQDRKGFSPLHLAAQSGTGLSLCELLLRHHADHAACSKQLEQPLHLAAAAGQEQVLRLLLQSAADPEAETAAEETPFSLAFSASHVRCCRAILDAGARVPAVEGGWTPPCTAFDARSYERHHAGKPEEDEGHVLMGC